MKPCCGGYKVDMCVCRKERVDSLCADFTSTDNEDFLALELPSNKQRAPSDSLVLCHVGGRGGGDQVLNVELAWLIVSGAACEEVQIVTTSTSNSFLLHSFQRAFRLSSPSRGGTYCIAINPGVYHC